MNDRQSARRDPADNLSLSGETPQNQVSDSLSGTTSYDSSKINRMISDISDDSIRQLLKIASLDTEMQGLPEDVDWNELCNWDIPMSMTTPSFFAPPVDMQVDVDLCKQRSNPQLRSESFLTYQDQYQSQIRKVDNSLHHIPEDHDFYNQEAMGSCQPGTIMDIKPNMAVEDSILYKNEGITDTEMMDGNQDRNMSQTRSYTHSNGTIDPRTMNCPVKMQTPQVNLQLGSNVVMLDPRSCPKPSVKVLPSQVIQGPKSNTVCLRGACLPDPDGGFNSRAIEGGGTYTDVNSWPTHPPMQESPHPMHMHDGQGSYMSFGTDEPTPSFTSHQPTSMTMVSGLNISDSMASHHFQACFGNLDGSHMFPPYVDPNDHLMHKDCADSLNLSITTQGRSSFEDLMQASSGILNMDQNAESEICSFVKSVAPQIQNNAWEEILSETNFEERLHKAELKVYEHNEELESIKQRMNAGEIKQPPGQELLRKAYNRREAASSRAKREQALLQAAIKKRTLEKICNWMREQLLGNSELFNETTPLLAKVRRSFSEGTTRL